jgi:nucleoside 2-deoxyribosyltransferase
MYPSYRPNRVTPEVKKNKIYVAGSVKNNINRIRDIVAVLSHMDYKISHDWTKTNQEKFNDDSTYRYNEMVNQLHGIRYCDFFVLVLPAGRGSYIELGYALSLNKKIFVLAENQDQVNEVGLLRTGVLDVEVVFNLKDLLDKLKLRKDESEIPF